MCDKYQQNALISVFYPYIQNMFVRHFHTGYGTFHCDSMTLCFFESQWHKPYACPKKMPHVRWSTTSRLRNEKLLCFLVIPEWFSLAFCYWRSRYSLALQIAYSLLCQAEVANTRLHISKNLACFAFEMPFLKLHIFIKFLYRKDKE